MKQTSFPVFLATLCMFPLLLRATHSDQELIPSTASVDLSSRSSLKNAPTHLKKQNLTRKERAAIRKEAKYFQRRILKTLTEEELRRAADVCLALDWNDEALAYLEKLEKITKNTTTVKNVKLEVADINFEQGNLKTAGKLYDEYNNLYPGDKEKAAYAQYKGILSNFYCMLENDRDQTRTLKTISLADSFLEIKSSLFKKYAQDVRTIKTHCFTRLYEHNVNVFEFYLKKSSFKAAETRLASIRSTLLPKLPGMEPNLLECEYRVAQAQKDTPRALKIAAELSTRFPNAQAEKRLVQGISDPNAVTGREYVDRF